MRRVLRDRYVGAVLLGLLLFQMCTALVKAVENPVMLWIQRASQHSALSAGQPWFNQALVLAAVTEAVFYLLVALLLGWWIYRPDRATEAAVEA